MKFLLFATRTNWEHSDLNRNEHISIERADATVNNDSQKSDNSTLEAYDSAISFEFNFARLYLCI